MVGGISRGTSLNSFQSTERRLMNHVILSLSLHSTMSLASILCAVKIPLGNGVKLGMSNKMHYASIGGLRWYGMSQYLLDPLKTLRSAL